MTVTCSKRYVENRDYVREKICWKCKQIFSSSDRLKYHLANVECEEIFKCIVCDRTLKTMNSVYHHCEKPYHKRNILKARHYFQCNVPGSRKPDQRGLLVNMYGHSDELLFQCSFKKFREDLFMDNVGSEMKYYKIVIDFFKLRNFDPTLPQYNNIYMLESQKKSQSFHYYDGDDWVIGDMDMLDIFIKKAIQSFEDVYNDLIKTKRITHLLRDHVRDESNNIKKIFIIEGATSKFFKISEEIISDKLIIKHLERIRSKLIDVLIANNRIPINTKKIQCIQKFFDEKTKKMTYMYPYTDT